MLTLFYVSLCPAGASNDDVLTAVAELYQLLADTKHLGRGSQHRIATLKTIFRFVDRQHPRLLVHISRTILAVSAGPWGLCDVLIHKTLILRHTAPLKNEGFSVRSRGGKCLQNDSGLDGGHICARGVCFHGISHMTLGEGNVKEGEGEGLQCTAMAAAHLTYDWGRSVMGLERVWNGSLDRFEI